LGKRELSTPEKIYQKRLGDQIKYTPKNNPEIKRETGLTAKQNKGDEETQRRLEGTQKDLRTTRN